MGDSDDDYERRRRDKFKRERNDYSERDRRRDAWEDTHRKERGRFPGGREPSWGRRGRDQYSSRDSDRRRDRYSPSPPPPSKRMRRDWDDRGPYSYDGSGFGQAGPPGWGPDLREYLGPQQGPYVQARLPEVDYPTQPAMMTFKKFLGQQDDTIGEEDAVKKYNTYKQEFQKQQVAEYFLAHKDEEWFKLKYHPEDSARRKEELSLALKCRLSVFNQLHAMGDIDRTILDTDNAKSIIRVLDSAVILMEGGTEEDLSILDMLPSDEELEKRRQEQQQRQQPQPSSSRSGGLLDTKPTAASAAAAAAAPSVSTTKAKEAADKPPPKAKKRRNKTGDYDDSDSASDSDSGSGSSGSSSNSSSSSDEDDDGDEPQQRGRTPTDKPQVKDESDRTAPAKGDDPLKDKDGSGDGKAEAISASTVAGGDQKLEDLLARAFHKTQSIFLRNLAPTITKQEVEALCKKYPGYLRLALQDPSAERKFFRRGWITFDRNVNIKDVCWNLGNIRLRDHELGATVNRDLKQRVRSANGLINHKQVVRNYIKLAAKIIQNMDARWRLWSDEADGDRGHELESECIGLVSKNPVLYNITNYLVDEASLEDELLGDEGDEKKEAGNVSGELSFDSDPELIKVLDRLVWYLRIVYSIDFYNGIEYPNEHEMPHRCGIIHARSGIPDKLPTQSEINDLVQHFEEKVRQFADSKIVIDDAEALLLGRKDPDAEVEKFITANTQELAKDKWLCPLSGKKFKGPDFVRKHILNKHAEKVDEVKKEAMYFNNYISDPRRPALQEHPASRAMAAAGGSSGRADAPFAVGGGGPGGFAQQPGMPLGFGPRPMQAPLFSGGPSFGGLPYAARDALGGRDPGRRNPYVGQRAPGGRRGERAMIEYKDLDAPEDVDIF